MPTQRRRGTEASLPKHAADLFWLLGLHPGPRIRREAVRALAREVVADDESALSELVRRGLVRQLDTHSFGVTATVHERMRERAGDQEVSQRLTAVARATDHYLISTRAANAHLVPHHRLLPPTYERSMPECCAQVRDAGSAARWLRHEHETLVALARSAHAAGLYQAAGQLADALWPLQWCLDPHPAHTRAWRDALIAGTESAKRSHNRVLWARMLGYHGHLLCGERQYAAAQQSVQQAMNVRDCSDQPWEQATLMLIAARALHGLGNTSQARIFLVQAMGLRQTAGDTCARELAVLGEIASVAGHHENALRLLTSALDDLGPSLAGQSATGSGVCPYRATIWRMLGQAERRAGHFHAANTALQQALTHTLDPSGLPLLGRENTRIHQALADLAREAGQPDQMRHHQRLVLKAESGA